MEENEDEPEDVQKATPVENEIEKGEVDESVNHKTEIAKRRDKPQRCVDRNAPKKNKTVKAKGDCCSSKRGKMAKASKNATVFIFDKLPPIPKPEIIPRHCLSKKEHIDVLATPQRKYQPSCERKPVIRRLRPISMRLVEMAQPTKNRLMATLEERGTSLPPSLLDNLIKTLEGETCMTPEQAENLFKDKERCSKNRNSRDRKKYKCRTKSKKPAAVGTTLLDKDAVNCQYLMAERFVKSILEWKCPIPKEEFSDIAEVILKRLSCILKYTPVGDEDRKSQQMRFLSDLIARWISGVLFEVAEAHRSEIEEECKRRKLEKEAETEEESESDEEEETKASDAEKESIDEDEDEDEDKREKEAKKKDEKRKEEAGKQGKPEAESRDLREEELEEGEKAAGGETEDEGERLEALYTTLDRTADFEDAEEMPGESEAETLHADEAAPVPEEPQDEEAVEEGQTEVVEVDVEKQSEEAEGIVTTETPSVEVLAQQPPSVEILPQQPPSVEILPQQPPSVEILPQQPPSVEILPQQPPSVEILPQQPPSVEILPEQPPSVEILPQQPPSVEILSQQRRSFEVLEESPQEGIPADRRIPLQDILDSVSPIEEVPMVGEVPVEVLEEVEEIEEVQVERPPTEEAPEMPVEGEVVEEIPKSEVIGDFANIFKTDIPFLTVGTILKTIHLMVENEKESPGDDPVTNRIHRAIFEKFTAIVAAENPKMLTENLKSLISLVSGKVALWLKRVLSDSRTVFFDANPAEVESAEIRDWSKWIDTLSDSARNWQNWIRNTIREAEDMKGKTVTRGQWHDWTKAVETNALLWRRFYLQITHQAHRNIVMTFQRNVVKSGQKKMPEFLEKEIKISNF
ncbi:uncharacterized abhydrolase domain-containing protein DDB_G0269086 isoform X2 [Orussus abietinus]|uniref:uncharacterized abhydrolase domain-containing protein DDB_G0269086 isoform X2 n=1 Tax=Orussus abietinus TaxID=222816 RepID=UPI00062564B3|nr:uncharacterized abhydrolase domain-containing protein DDB_G0269086 isoform X2 [Orussus abietinus]